MKKLLTTFILLFSSYSWGDWNNWSDTDKKMFIASNVAIAADWLTTRNFAGHKELHPGTYETNPIIGKYPSQERVDLYFIGIVVSNYYIADWLPKELRGFYLGVRTGAHGTAAISNMNLGWKMEF